MILVLMGVEIDLEVLTDKGRIDGVLELSDKIYLIELHKAKRFLNESRPRRYLGIGIAGKEIGYQVQSE